MTDAEVLNDIERRLRKGKATDKEKRLLSESYMAFNVPIPKDIMRLL